MGLLHILIVALVQGITEFLPISSSGHLILIPALTGYEDQGLLIDVAVHVGTLVAVLLYFWRDTRGLFLAFLAAAGLGFARRSIADTRYRQLFWALVIGTLPVVVFGFVFYASGLSSMLRSINVIATTSIIFGLLLYWADKRGARERTMNDLKLKDGLYIGLAQILALIPGTSRSGITMTAGRYLGFERKDAARFSMLMAIPAILAAGSLAGIELIQKGMDGVLLDAMMAAALAFVAALGAIHFLMKWLARSNMTIFVIYRVLMGLGLLVWFNF